MSISVVTLGTSTWSLVDGLERLHGDVTVVRRCLELADLLACAHTGMADVALVAEGAEELTASMLGQLADNGLCVLVVEGHDSARLARLGVSSVPSGASGEELAHRVERAARTPRCAGGASSGEVAAEPGPTPRSSGHAVRTVHAAGGVARTGTERVSGAGREAVGELDAARSGGVLDAPGDALGAGSADAPPRLIAVWGPAGAPGRTVTAVNLAVEAALLGRRVLLVDADTYAASIAASLGMLDEIAGLAQACRLADQGRLDAGGLTGCATSVAVAGASVDVLTGITRQDRWPELRSSALDAVLGRAAQEYETVVVDISFNLESDEEISIEFLTPRRNAAALGVLAAADTVLAVGAADALGIPRLVKALPDLEDVAQEARVVVVVNKLRAGAAGRSAEASVAEAWRRFSPGHDIAHLLPWDPAVCDDALLAGAALAETAPRSELRQEFTALARDLLTGQEPATVGATGGAGEMVTGTRLGRRMGAWLRRGRV